MTVYAVCKTGKEANTFVAHPNAEEARRTGNGFSIVTTAADLSDKRLYPTRLLVDIYNKNVIKQIAKFRDRATAEKKVFDLFRSVKVTPSFADLEETVDPTKEVKAPSAKGRPTGFVGKSFKATLKQNPRRAGTISHKWYELIMENPGISYEKLKEHYGSEDFTRHLRHDIRLGRIETLEKGQ